MEYSELKQYVSSVVDGVDNLISNLANVSAVLYGGLDDVSWVGFYFADNDGNLVLGPFQGKPACTLIRFGKGVCGTAVKNKRVIRVDDVHTFEGHIACDSESNSEIVLPVIKDGKVLGVLDIDSKSLCRFTNDDECALSEIVDLLANKIF